MQKCCLWPFSRLLISILSFFVLVPTKSSRSKVFNHVFATLHCWFPFVKHFYLMTKPENLLRNSHNYSKMLICLCCRFFFSFKGTIYSLIQCLHYIFMPIIKQILRHIYQISLDLMKWFFWEIPNDFKAKYFICFYACFFALFSGIMSALK